MKTLSLAMALIFISLSALGASPHHSAPAVNKHLSSDPHYVKQITALKSAAAICMKYQVVTSAASKAAGKLNQTVTYQSGFENCPKAVALLNALRAKNTAAATSSTAGTDSSRLNNLIAPYAGSLE